MTEKDENAQKKDQDPKRTREVPIPLVGEVTIPDEQPASEAEPAPDAQPRQIHRRRPLPLVPQKPEDPDGPGGAPNP